MGNFVGYLLLYTFNQNKTMIHGLFAATNIAQALHFAEVDRDIREYEKKNPAEAHPFKKFKGNNNFITKKHGNI